MSDNNRCLFIGLGVLFLSLFLPFFIISGGVKMGLWDQLEVSISSPDDESDKGQILLENCLRPQSGASQMLTLKRHGNNAVRFHAGLLLMQILILMFQEKRYLAAYPAYQTPLARFLWDLFARQRKDGKKRGLIFSM